jgi:hypothetical protein
MLDINVIYRWIEHCMDQSLPALLQHFPDPGAFFVRRVETGTRFAAIDTFALYDVWVLLVQQYGFYNLF